MELKNNFTSKRATNGRPYNQIILYYRRRATSSTPHMSISHKPIINSLQKRADMESAPTRLNGFAHIISQKKNRQK